MICIDYWVTIQVVSNLPLTSKQKFRFGMRSLYKTPRSNRVGADDGAAVVFLLKRETDGAAPPIDDLSVSSFILMIRTKKGMLDLLKALFLVTLRNGNGYFGCLS